MDLSVVSGGQDLNQTPLICSKPLKQAKKGTHKVKFEAASDEADCRSYFDRIVDFLGIMVGWGSHQAHDETLKFPCELIFQIFNQILIKKILSI